MKIEQAKNKEGVDQYYKMYCEKYSGLDLVKINKPFFTGVSYSFRIFADRNCLLLVIYYL